MLILHHSKYHFVFLPFTSNFSFYYYVFGITQNAIILSSVSLLTLYQKLFWFTAPPLSLSVALKLWWFREKFVRFRLLDFFPDNPNYLFMLSQKYGRVFGKIFILVWKEISSLFEHSNLDLSALPVSPTGVLYALIRAIK